MVQGQSRCDDHVHVVDINNAAGMVETYGTYVDAECWGIHDYHNDTDLDTDNDTDDDTGTEILMILMMILMIVAAGTCILSKFPGESLCT